MQLNTLQQILRTVSSVMQYPIIVILLIFIAFAIFCIGWIIVEAAVERRHMRYFVPKLLDQLKKNPADIARTINESGLLERQKQALTELTKHPDFDKEMLESLADNLIEKEQSHYDTILKMTNLVSKLAPMAGLLGTLIPLGPGIIALGNGDTYTLSQSMLTAFDTTIAGLLAAGICLIIHTIRNHWYASYMSDLETLVDCVTDIEAGQNAAAQAVAEDAEAENEPEK